MGGIIYYLYVCNVCGYEDTYEVSDVEDMQCPFCINGIMKMENMEVET